MLCVSNEGSSENAALCRARGVGWGRGGSTACGSASLVLVEHKTFKIYFINYKLKT
jgi:hypothetical protein